MQKLTDLPFAISIEVVGNFLYLYTKDQKVEFSQLLEILSKAFDQMKVGGS